MAVNTSYERNLGPVEMIGVAGAETARVECVQCGAIGDWRIAGRRPPPDIVQRHFITRGWNLRKRPICEQCSKRKEVPMTAKVTPINPAPVIVPTDAKAQRRDAHALIELTFDIAVGAYRDGYSDHRISKETGISEAWVAKRREDEFGPLKVPDEIGELRRAITEAASNVGKLTTQLNDLIRRNGWAG